MTMMWTAFIQMEIEAQHKKYSYPESSKFEDSKSPF